MTFFFHLLNFVEYAFLFSYQIQVAVFMVKWWEGNVLFIEFNSHLNFIFNNFLIDIIL